MTLILIELHVSLKLGCDVHINFPKIGSVQFSCSVVSDAIQPSHPLSSPSPALNVSQHQGLFQRISSLNQVAKVLELQHQSFHWIFSTDFLYDCLISLQSKELSRVFSNTIVQNHQFFSPQLSLWPNFHIYTWLLVKL